MFKAPGRQAGVGARSFSLALRNSLQSNGKSPIAVLRCLTRAEGGGGPSMAVKRAGVIDVRIASFRCNGQLAIR